MSEWLIRQFASGRKRVLIRWTGWATQGTGFQAVFLAFTGERYVHVNVGVTVKGRITVTSRLNDGYTCSGAQLHVRFHAWDRTAVGKKKEKSE